MKVTFRNMIQAYSGKCDGLVYYYNRKYNRMIVRQLPRHKETSQNSRFGAVAKNLKALAVSAGYRSDLMLYTELYSSQAKNWAHPVNGWYTVFVKLMWAMSHSLEIDLASLTREQIYTQELPCISVKTAVDAGLLVPVRDYQNLINLL
jgi:hypothetical protein